MNAVFTNWFLRKNLWPILALYFLNIAVDPTDAIYYNINENSATNNQESLIELVVEKVLGFENAIPEQNDNDDPKGSVFKKIKLQEFVFGINLLKSNSNFHEITSSKKIISPNYFFFNLFSEVISPPPKVSLYIV